MKTVTGDLTCVWKQLKMSLISLKSYDTIQVVGKMGNLISTNFDCIGCRSRIREERMRELGMFVDKWGMSVCSREREKVP